MSEQTRGKCRQCGRAIQLKKDGTLRQHNDWQRDEYWCKGAGQPPAE